MPQISLACFYLSNIPWTLLRSIWAVWITTYVYDPALHGLLWFLRVYTHIASSGFFLCLIVTFHISPSGDTWVWLLCGIVTFHFVCDKLWSSIRTDLLCFCAVGVTRLYYTKEVFFSSIVAIAFSFSTGLAGGCQYNRGGVLQRLQNSSSLCQPS